MRENVTRADVNAMVAFLAQDPLPRLTQGDQVRAFEEEFAQWLGVKHAVFVNSGASANLITMAALRIMRGPLRVAVPVITWVSDIAAVLHAGHAPVFTDVDPRTLGMRNSAYAADVIFPTHCLGFFSGNEAEGGLLIEDCCESLGATHDAKKLGTFGLASNFSFYYAHHMSTIEGGMVCTNDDDFYQTLRMLRSHGLVREMSDPAKKDAIAASYPDLDPEFIFAMPAYNVRSTELNAVIGRSQLKRVDESITTRTENLMLFLSQLDAAKYRVDYRVEGSSNYALPLVLREADAGLMERVVALLRASGVEHRRGTAGGGNQLRQPYAKARFGEHLHKRFPEAEHIHQFGLYLGNYPSLEDWKIEELCKGLNAL